MMSNNNPWKFSSFNKWCRFNRVGGTEFNQPTKHTCEQGK